MATILVLLLGIGVVAGLTRFLMRQLRFWLQMRRVTPLRTGPAYDVLQQLLVDQSLKQPVRLCETDQFDEPIACGIFRWRIVLPPGSESRLERGQLQAMLAHELAHLVRRDTLWLCFGHVLCSTLWFQPLNRLARRRWQQAAEFLCDAWAVRESRINPLTLAQSLTRIAEWRLGERTSVRLLTATGSSSTLTARVTHLVERSKDPDRWQSRWRRRSFLGGLLIAAAVFAILAPRAALTQPIPARATSDAGRTRPERQPVASRSDSASHSESPRAVHTPALNPANQHDNTLQHTTSSTAERPQLLSEWTLLQQELQELNRSLAEVSLLLESRSDDPRLREVARRIRDRTAALEQRRSELQRLLFPPVPLSRHEHDIPVRPAGVPDRVSLSDRPSVLSFREKNS